LAEPGNWQNVMGATLSVLSEKEKRNPENEKRKPRKRKAPFENKKTPRKRLPTAGDMSNFARADRDHVDLRPRSGLIRQLPVRFQ
jgi:hypothetical protein